MPCNEPNHPGMGVLDEMHRRRPEAASTAACYFESKYGKSGTRTFILSEYNSLYWKDTKGKAPEVFPADLQKTGWRKLD